MSQRRRGGESEAAASGPSTPPAGARRVTPVDVDAPMGATAERRRVERRGNIRVADLSLPELRRMMVTSVLSALVLVLFLWMVRGVLIAAILGVVMAAYMRPVYEWVRRGVRSSSGAALVTLGLLLIPVAAALAYSYLEVVRVARYLAGHEHEIATQIDSALSRFAIVGRPDTSAAVERWVIAASNYGASLPGMVRRAVVRVSVATTIFLFTAFYIFTDADQVIAYVRAKVPPRYADLASAFETNVRGVLYGAIYATLVTQALKSGVIFFLNRAFGVPLAGVLAILSFIIGFFPIVGSWSVYVPVAAWLLVFRDAPVQATLMVVIGTLVNTLFISMYLRPKLAADRSRVLNFYWMLVGLVTGVYTFGLAGILLGPILIGLLKAVVDTLSSTSSWRSLDGDGATPPGGAEAIVRQ